MNTCGRTRFRGLHLITNSFTSPPLLQEIYFDYLVLCSTP